MVKQIIKYEISDGRVFDTELEAKEMQNSVDLAAFFDDENLETLYGSDSQSHRVDGYDIVIFLDCFKDKILNYYNFNNEMLSYYGKK